MKEGAVDKYLAFSPLRYCFRSSRSIFFSGFVVAVCLCVSHWLSFAVSRSDDPLPALGYKLTGPRPGGSLLTRPPTGSYRGPERSDVVVRSTLSSSGANGLGNFTEVATLHPGLVSLLSFPAFPLPLTV